MQRLLRLSLLALLLCILAFSESYSQGRAFLSGEIQKGHVRILVKDSLYVINRDYTVYGSLLIEPGTEVKFNPDGRLIIAKGGRVVADGDANADYIANPTTPDGNYSTDPIGLPGGPTNPLSFTGYADLNYFLYKSGSNETVKVLTKRDATVNKDKYDYIFNVMLDKANRRVVDLDEPGNPSYPGNANYVKIPFESAIVFTAARLMIDPANDNNLNIYPWKRIGNLPPDFNEARIKFIGQPVNDFSREWGHIVVLPGARAAFFRNCSFEGFRKDTTVDRTGFYSANPSNPNYIPGLTTEQINSLNAKMISLTNGGGGAMTTFSSRTWLLECDFTNNMSRYRGGALQILQAPAGFPMDDYDEEDLGYYASNKNPHITNADGSISSIITENPIPMIDMIDEAGYTEPLSDMSRMAYDDGRLSLYLGRMRNLKFDQNYVRLTNVKFTQIGSIRKVEDDLDNPANYPYGLHNHAYGGAIYIAGADGGENRQIDLGLGINNSIMIGGKEVAFPDEDTFEAMGNSANNYQNAASTFGSRGGAVYVGKYSSVIAAGKYHSNETYTKYLQDEATGSNSGYYSMGGAIFMENTLGRLQLRGGPAREDISNVTDFYQNLSGAGGAIFVDGNTSPLAFNIGGSDVTVDTRDYGYNINFRDNEAVSWGGAVYTKRQMFINGAGGVAANELIGYDDDFKVTFINNMAGYAGGAVYVGIPNANPPLPAYQRVINIIRAVFRDNKVGMNITGEHRQEVRGGGAIYSLNGDLNVVKAVEFRGNAVKNGNGGALCLVHPLTSAKRFFVSDLDMIHFSQVGVADGYTSNDDLFTFKPMPYDPDARMLTRFLDNTAEAEEDVLNSSYGSGSGTTQVGKGTLPTTAALYSTTWIDNNTGYSVGFNGTIVKYTQGGTKWEYQNSGTSYRLTDVYFTSATNGFISGDRGIILKTTNGGGLWNRINTPTDQRINDLTFIGTANAFAVCNGGYVLMSTDGGNNWTSSRPELANLSSIFFVSNQVGWIVGERGLVLKTTNAGASWQVQLINTLVNLNSVVFVDATNGFIVGNAGVIFKTANGGNTWVRVNTTSTNDYYSIHFTSQSTGYVGGTFGEISKTIDGGDTWTALTTGTTNHLYDIFFTTTNRGYSVGNYGLLLGTTDAGTTWTSIRPADESLFDVTRLHQEIMLPENGVGLGGAIYVLDSVTVNRLGRTDTVNYNRVRIENNTAYTGAAIYSDNYDMKLIFNRSLIVGNTATSEIGTMQNYITGPVVRDNNDAIIANNASHDLASAVIYGEIQGPLPSAMYPEAGNSIFDNHARFLIRLPDAPNTKGVLAGTTGIGFGGTDTLRGNYWGNTEADVDMVIDHSQGTTWDDEVFETFFVAGDGKTHLQFLFSGATDPRTQGPFETFGTREVSGTEEIVNYTYRPVPLMNGADENTPDATSIPEVLLQSGHIYDIYDKGTDIKTADYKKRKLTPIEDFAVGLPPTLQRYNNVNMPSFDKYIKRWTRNPFAVEEIDDQTGTLKYPELAFLQDEFRPNPAGEMYHPIGYPMYLETMVDYSGNDEKSNHDTRFKNETVFFLINETTLDYIRVCLDQVSEEAPLQETFRTRVELVPDLTYRNPNTLLRRTAQGLYNLGVGNILLEHIYQDPYQEELSTLPGRRYHGDKDNMGKATELYYNRDEFGNPYWPSDNAGTATHYAGEKYHALPVNVGDQVRIVSRTVLWKEGVIPAMEDGIVFKVIRSTEPPVYTGNVVTLQTDTLTMTVPHEFEPKDTTIQLLEFLNTVFVTEDRYYPVTPGWYSTPLDPSIGKDDKGRDSIVTITAIDSNNYYDPRSIRTPENYPYLTYTWSVAPNSGLARWLYVDTVRASDPSGNNDIPFYEAKGYLKFTGKPINPYVVPGGESVFVTAANYPPHYRTLDSLKALGYDDETIAQFVNIFPPYYHAQAYDDLNDRYLQQDTIDLGGSTWKTKPYEFKIFVVDSTPRFLEPESTREEVYKQVDWEGNTELYVVYEPSNYNCPLTEDGKMVANLTDKLRFKADFNTDDEMEDQWAENWDFRYGKTAYGFMNIALRPYDDTTRIDTTYYDPNVENDTEENDILISQSRPIWMGDEYLHEYGDGTTDPQADPFGVFLTTFGKLDIRIDSAYAINNLLQPNKRYNEALNLDTVFTIVVNDGHGGLNFKTMPVYVNVAPAILDANLPNAKEDYDYNPQLLDSSKMIKVWDPNFDQSHRFELIYTDESRTEIPRDECFPEAGSWDLTNMKTTPKWLKINAESGLLYGTPYVDKDDTFAPKDEVITVVVYDEGNLTHIKQFRLRVDSTNHAPKFANYPINRCVDINKAYTEIIKIVDKDLLRDEPEVEEITITAQDVNGNALTGWTITPNKVRGTKENDTVEVTISTSNFNLPVDPDGKVTIKIIVDDGEERTELVYRLKISDPTDFVCPITITNYLGAVELLEWGTAPIDATTGDEKENIGNLDYNLCEFELPPLPPTDVFDSRWNIPTRNGTIRNIFPRATQGQAGADVYRGQFQSGGIDGNTSPAYPVTITWDAATIPSTTDPNNPSGAQWFIEDGHSDGSIFHINMKTLYGEYASYIRLDVQGTVATLTILANTVTKFNILYDWNSPVQPVAGMPTEVKINSVSPNPLNRGNASIEFGLPTDSQARLEVIDALGNVVTTLASDVYNAGFHSIQWDGRDVNGVDLPSGTYTCRLVAGGASSAYPFVIIK